MVLKVMSALARYWHTLRYLRPVQVYGRLWFRLYRPRPDVRPAPAVRPVEGSWVAPVARPVSLLGPTTFRLLNATHEVAPGPEAWNDPARDKLWLYNLHYFDDLNAAPSLRPSPAWGEGARDATDAEDFLPSPLRGGGVGGEEDEGSRCALPPSPLRGGEVGGEEDEGSRCALPPSPPAGEGWGEGVQGARDQRLQWHLALLTRWVAENPPGVGNGWEPYPTSLRIVNWIKWALAPSALNARFEPGRLPVGADVGVLPDLEGHATRRRQNLPPECLHSLAIQARWLRRRLEYHLLGNHLFANAKALVFAGAFFVGPEGAAGAMAREPAQWLALGQRLLRRELAEQILPDGGHFERSPMYHAILLEDVLDVLNLAGAYPGTLDPGLVARCREQAAAMLRWLAVMCHPDGEIGFFNDAATGIAPRLAELVAYGRRLGVAEPATRASDADATAATTTAGQSRARGPGSPTDTPVRGHGGRQGDHPLRDKTTKPAAAPIWLRDSGYIRLEARPAVALLDVAPIGPDYLPGHAHADTLSFELSLFGQRVIVNGGTSRYGSGPERLAERGTAAHSTVQIDGADSSEVWGGFRVARRARPFAVQVRRGDPVEEGVAGGTAQHAVQKVTAAHDGYRRLPGRPVHRREWRLTPDHFSVADTIEGGYGVAVARFHLHPAIGIEGPAMAIEGPAFASEGLAMTGDGMETSAGGGPSAWGFPPGGHLLLPGGQRVHWQVTGGRVRLVPDHWHPEFGLSVASRCLEVEFADGVCRLDLTWAAEV